MDRWVGWPLCPHQAVRLWSHDSLLHHQSSIESTNSKHEHQHQCSCDSSNCTAICTLTNSWLIALDSEFYQTHQTTNPRGSKTEIWSPGSHVAEAMSKVSVSKPARCWTKTGSGMLINKGTVSTCCSEAKCKQNKDWHSSRYCLPFFSLSKNSLRTLVGCWNSTTLDPSSFPGPQHAKPSFHQPPATLVGCKLLCCGWQIQAHALPNISAGPAHSYPHKNRKVLCLCTNCTNPVWGSVGSHCDIRTHIIHSNISGQLNMEIWVSISFKWPYPCEYLSLIAALLEPKATLWQITNIHIATGPGASFKTCQLKSMEYRKLWPTC